jgi:putative hemolysin
MSTSLPLTAALITSIVFAFLALAAVKLETFNKAKLRKLRDNSKRLAERIELILPTISRLRLAAHLLVLLALLGSIACYLSWAADKTRLYSGITGGVLILLILLFLEITIEKLSLPATARLLIFTLPLFKAATWLFSPLVFPLDLWIQRIRDQDDDPLNLDKVTVEDEILSLVEEDEEEEPGAASSSGLEQDERRMLNGVINLDKTFVHEIMTPRVDMDVLPETASIDEMKKTIAKTGHSRIPIYHQSIDSISGIVYAKDLLDDGRVEKASDVRALAHSPVFIPESKNVGDLLDEFRQTRNHLAIVLDEYGGTAGVVTIEDILEEIVGEIRDEYDLPVDDEIKKVDDRQFMVSGQFALDELEEFLGMEFPPDDRYETVAGLLMTQFGRIPSKGEEIVLSGVRFRVEAVQGPRVRKVKISLEKPLLGSENQISGENNY